MKVLYIDAGNSFIKFAYRHERKLEIESVTSIDKLVKSLKSLKKTQKFSRVVVSSVLNRKNTLLLRNVLLRFAAEVVFISDIVSEIIKTDYDLLTLGDDRVATLLYVAFTNNNPAVIIDAGTAITIDYLGDSNTFLGGYICSGLELEYQALSLNTQKLSKIDIHVRKTDKIPLKTSLAIQMGVLKVKALGISKMIEYDLKRINQNIIDWNIFLTGGSASLLKPYLDKSLIINNMVIKGLEKAGRKLK